MIHLIRSFHAFLRRGIAAMLQYRGEIALWAIWGLVYPAVSYALWSAASDSRADRSIAGFDRGDFAAYFLIIMIVGHVSAAWDTYEMGHLVRTGEMSARLLRPILPIWESLASNLAYKITTLVFLIPAWCLFGWWVRPTLHPTASQLAFGVAAVTLGAVLNFILNYSVALIAFWSPKLDATGELYFGAGLIWGGRFAPLAVFDTLPAFMGIIADVLPFRWMFAFPTELLMGRITDTGVILRGLGAQVAWIAIGILAFRAFWAAAVRRYSAVSG